VPDGFEVPESALFARARKAYEISDRCFEDQFQVKGEGGSLSGAIEDIGGAPSLSVVGASEAAGKSGAFFFLTEDQSMIAKTCTAEDWDTLLQILPDYVAHLEKARQNAGTQSYDADLQMEQSASLGLAGNQLWTWSMTGFADSLLPRYLGLYAFNGPSTSGSSSHRKHRFVLMANVFAGARRIHCKYDLKGSTHGRRSNKKERQKKSPVLKDLDWLDAEIPANLMGPLRDLLLDALRADAAFLSAKGLIDYSLLVGIHKKDPDEKRPSDQLNKIVVTPRGVQSNRSSDSVSECSGKQHFRIEAEKVVCIEEADRVLYIGIVDVLTPYRCRKRLETFLLSDLRCGKDVSCQKPQKYADRFVNFLAKNVFP